MVISLTSTLLLNLRKPTQRRSVPLTTKGLPPKLFMIKTTEVFGPPLPPEPKHHNYLNTIIPRESEYKGLSDADVMWLRDFNLLESNQVAKTKILKKPSKKQQKLLNKTQHARRSDAATWAPSIETLTPQPNDPWDATISLIDNYQKLQRKIKRK